MVGIFKKVIIMTQLYLFEKEEVMKKTDYVATIMQEWYDAMEKANVQVQPKTSTMLGQILTKYDIQPKQRPSKEDLFDQYMNTKGGDWDAFWSRLSAEEKEYIESRRQKMRDEYYSKRNLVDNNAKSLLKG
jgi:hypothetical protein